MIRTLSLLSVVALVGCGAGDSVWGSNQGNSNNGSVPIVPNQTQITLNDGGNAVVNEAGSTSNNDAGSTINNDAGCAAGDTTIIAGALCTCEPALAVGWVCPAIAPTCPKQDCVHSFGYWKCHATWPCNDPVVAYLPTGALYPLNESEALTIMNMVPLSNAVLILLDQLIPAVINGGEWDPAISATINAARIWLTQFGFDTTISPPVLPGYVDVNSALGSQARSYADTLEKFNNGMMGTSSCR